MKIDSKKLISFVKKVHMNEIDECLFEFTDSGLKITATTPAKMSFVDGMLKKEAFEDYEAFGPVALNDVKNIINVLGRFGKEVELKKEGNLLTVKNNNKSVSIELMASQFLEKEQKIPDIKPDETFTLAAKEVDEIFKDVKMNKDAELIIETREGVVRFSNTGKYKFQNDFPNENIKQTVKVKFGMPLITAIENLSENIEFGVKTDYPALIKEVTDESEILIIVAPRVENKG